MLFHTGFIKTLRDRAEIPTERFSFRLLGLSTRRYSPSRQTPRERLSMRRNRQNRSTPSRGIPRLSLGLKIAIVDLSEEPGTGLIERAEIRLAAHLTPAVLPSRVGTRTSVGIRRHFDDATGWNTDPSSSQNCE